MISFLIQEEEERRTIKSRNELADIESGYHGPLYFYISIEIHFYFFNLKKKKKVNDKRPQMWKGCQVNSQPLIWGLVHGRGVAFDTAWTQTESPLRSQSLLHSEQQPINTSAPQDSQPMVAFRRNSPDNSRNTEHSQQRFKVPVEGDHVHAKQWEVSLPSKRFQREVLIMQCHTVTQKETNLQVWEMRGSKGCLYRCSNTTGD